MFVIDEVFICTFPQRCFRSFDVKRSKKPLILGGVCDGESRFTSENGPRYVIETVRHRARNLQENSRSALVKSSIL